MPTPWHQVHLGCRAVGGAGLVMVEATAVSPEGRISPDDSGIWSDTHIAGFQPVARFIREQGAVAGIQLAHAGRKASTNAPWRGGGFLGPRERGWTPVAPSPIAFHGEWEPPRELRESELEDIVRQFRASAERSLKAGFQLIELHMAHGYLLHQFLSPLSNHRNDAFGGSFENRIRFPLQVARAVRDIWPDELPLFVRISATDWVNGGWDLEQSVRFCHELKRIGIDLIDCSSGGLVPDARIETGPSYQVPFAHAIRRECRIATGAVGMITEPRQAEDIIAEGKADAVLMAREFLRDPYWPLHAAKELGTDLPWPRQYGRAKG